MCFNKMLTSIATAALVLLSGQVAAGGQTQSLDVNTSSALDSRVEERMKEAGMVGLGAAIIVKKEGRLGEGIRIC